ICAFIGAGVEVWRIARQAEQPGAARLDGRAHACDLVRAEIVQDHDVAGPQRRCEHLLDIGAEPFAVDRSIDDEGSSEPIAAQAGNESHRLPMTVGDGADEALASRTAAIAAYHVGGDPGLVDEDETSWVQSPLAVAPSRAGRRHVRPVLLGGTKRL